MNLKDYNRWLESAPTEWQKKIIADFISFTLDYAQNHIELRKQELSSCKADEWETKINRLQKWLSYIEFQEHTLRELQGHKLNVFFKKNISNNK